MSLRAVGTSLVLLLVPVVAGAQEPAKKPPLVIESMAGKDLFLFYCGSCHGSDAKGRGPVASALKSPPADLTTIAMRSGGVFPRARITAFVSKGDAQVAAHGTPDMPVWGPIFTGLDPSDARTKVRIENLVAYVESLQVR
ncbi:MAG TPA: cytochrome c [Vicinamibacterales bacterium]|jgi:mono/diheme cytochrome c family protein|nr:cytochrome c [Vicinamibacterales bacterium]